MSDFLAEKGNQCGGVEEWRPVYSSVENAILYFVFKIGLWNGLFTNARTKFPPCDILCQILIFKYLNSLLMVSFSEVTAHGMVWGGDKGGHEKERTGHGLHISFIEKHMAAGRRMIRSQQQTFVLSLQSQDRRMCNPEIPKWLLTPKGDRGAWWLKCE